MPKYLVEIQPKKVEFDPLAHHVQSTLIEFGTETPHAVVHTKRLFRIEGELTASEAEKITQSLLVDPVVETGSVISETSGKKTKGSKKGGLVANVWPKPGVTDPVGETVEKGIHDLGINGPVKAASAYQYHFPKINDKNNLSKFARQFLGNELIHDISISQ